MIPHIGTNAFDLAREHVPQDLRAEAWWWVKADGLHGKDIFYDGEREGIHWWVLGGDLVYIRSKPPAMSLEDTEKLDQTMRWYYEREWEQMIDNLDNRESIVI